MKQAVILAGGKGTRLKERLGDLPKPLIDVDGMPLLERQILLLKRYGFRQVLVLVNYNARHIVDFCRGKNNWGLDIHCINDGQRIGTAGAVLDIFDRLEDECLIMYGDTMLDVDLDRFYRFHREKSETAATLFLHPNDHPQDSDLVECDEQGSITTFYPYPHDPERYYPNLVSAALYWLRKASIEPWRKSDEGMLDFGKQLFPAMLKAGLKLRGYNSPEYIKDCGTPARIDKVVADLRSGKIARSALDQKQAAVFLDRDGTVNREVNHLSCPDQFQLIPGAEEAIRRLNKAEYRLCIITNQPVIARGECTLQDLRAIHNKMETLLGTKGGFVDRIYYCPHHPDKGFAGEVPELKINCNCRKPKTGMIDQGMKELNIERSRSWLLGDTTTDMLAAERAGLKSILVETGHAGLDHKYWARPDFTVPDLAAAVSLILDTYPELLQRVEPLAASLKPGAVVFIGGQSRSGKSSVASALRHALQKRGRLAHILSTDRWLLNEAERGVGVLQRHKVDAIHAMLAMLMDPAKRPAQIKLPGYHKLRREQIADAETLLLAPTDVMIIEGVVALYFANNLKAPVRLFVEIDEKLRRQRIQCEYRLRGYTAEKAAALYSERLQEEVPWVAATAADAEKISMPLISTDEEHSL